VRKNVLCNNIVHFETVVDNVIHCGIVICDINPASLALPFADFFPNFKLNSDKMGVYKGCSTIKTAPILVFDTSCLLSE
jgi:hypothetical protein